MFPDGQSGLPAGAWERSANPDEREGREYDTNRNSRSQHINNAEGVSTRGVQTSPFEVRTEQRDVGESLAPQKDDLPHHLHRPSGGLGCHLRSTHAPGNYMTYIGGFPSVLKLFSRAEPIDWGYNYRRCCIY